jgi:hypothetical protein
MLSFFNSIIDNFKKNRLSVFTIGFSTVTFLKDVEEMITHFLDNIKYVFGAFSLISLIFIIDFFYKRFKPTNSLSFKNQFQLNKTILKTGGLFCLFVFTFSILTFVYVKNHPIYYVKLAIYKNSSKAVVFKDSINNLFNKNQEKNLQARILTRSFNVNKYKDGNYIVVLNGGFISEQKAIKTSLLAKNYLGNSINPEVSKPTINISVLKKIKYLINNR